jgi:hypothetical protein
MQFTSTPMSFFTEEAKVILRGKKMLEVSKYQISNYTTDPQ